MCHLGGSKHTLLSSTTQQFLENRNTPHIPRDEHTSGAVIQSSGMIHSRSLQMYAGSIGKQMYFPTGQLRARPICTSTALGKHHHTAEDSISMLHVLKPPQYAVEQHGHTL